MILLWGDFVWEGKKKELTFYSIFLGFCLTNYALVYFFVYARMRGWSFGFGYLFKGLKFITRQ